MNANGGQRYQQEYRSGDVYGGDDIAGPPPPLPRLPPPDWTLEARRRLYPEVCIYFLLRQCSANLASGRIV